MPQLDLATYPSQLFWLTIFFCALYIFVKTYIAPRIESLISIRNDKIEKDLNLATKAKGQTEELRADYEKSRKHVFSKISSMLEGELSNLQRVSQEQSEKTALEISNITKKAEDEIEIEQEKYKQELENRVLEYTAFLINKVSNLAPTKDKLTKYKN